MAIAKTADNVSKYSLSTIKQFAKFVLVGAMNTGVDLLVLNLETTATGIKDGVGYGIQKGISFLVAVTFSYFLNKNWTFQDKTQKEEGKKFAQFFIVSIVGMVINVITATLVATYAKPLIGGVIDLEAIPFVAAMGVDQLWVNIGALSGTAFGLIWNFIGYKFIVFKK